MSQPQRKLFRTRPSGGKPNSRSHKPQKVRVSGDRIIFRLGGNRRCRNTGRYLERHPGLKLIDRFTTTA